jgi:hypothetical protein
MQYESYRETVHPHLQTTYELVLTIIALSPLAAFLLTAFQIGLGGVPIRVRIQKIVITLACWTAVVLLLGALGIPVVDYIID